MKNFHFRPATFEHSSENAPLKDDEIGTLVGEQVVGEKNFNWNFVNLN